MGLFAFVAMLCIFQTGNSLGRAASYMDFTNATKFDTYNNSVMDSNIPFQYYSQQDFQSIHYDDNKKYVVDTISKPGHVVVLEYNSKDKITDKWELDFFSLGVSVYEEYNWDKIYDADSNGKAVKDGWSKVYTHKEESTRTFRYGGFHFGDKYNYLVLGGERIGWFTDHLAQNKWFLSPLKKVVQAPAYRIIKYSKDFKQLDYLDIEYGVQNKLKDSDVTHDIARPFGFSTVSMAESPDGKELIVSTGREGYDDGSTHHQYGVQFIIDVKSFEKMNAGISVNFVSHSLDQYVAYDGDTKVFADLSDANPHGIKMNIFYPDGARKNLSSIHNTPVIGGYYLMHMNLGGLAIGEESYLLPINTMDLSYTDVALADTNTKSIMVMVVDKETYATTKVTLADYHSEGKKGTKPYIVSLGNDNFAILWQEFTTSNQFVATCYAIVNSKAEVVLPVVKNSDIYLNRWANPIFVDDEIVWFVDTQDGRVFNRIKVEV